MKLKNSALQELYYTLVSAGVSMFSYADSPVYKAFKECDEKLSESITFATIKDLQDRNDILEESNKSLLAGNLNLSTEKNILKNRISRLEELLMDANTTLEKVNADRNNLQEVCDKLSEENNKIAKKLDDAKKNVEYFRDCRDNWRARAKHAEKEVEDLGSQYQKLTIENKTLHLEVNWYRKHYKEQSDKIQDLKSRLNSMCGDKYIKKLQDDVDFGAYQRGQTDLWDMLQEVSDYYYFGSDDEFDTDDCEMTSMTDIIDNLNVDQFLEAYTNWHKAQKQTWECTLKGNIKINGDLLGKVCGIKIDDDK